MDKEAIIRPKFFGQAVERRSYHRSTTQKNRKIGYKAACGSLNLCPLLLVMIRKPVDISFGLVIDKAVPFRYTV